MRRLLFGIAVVAMISVVTMAAYAQEQGGLGEDEFGQFRQQLRAVKNSNLPSVAKKKLGLPAGAPNNADKGPLGVAGALPLGKPLDNNAMDEPQTPEELQAQIDAKNEAQKKKLEQQTFDMALKQLLPMSPEEIRKTLDQFRISREAAETAITIPEPKQEVKTASLDPSDPPLVIRTAPNVVTTVTILDASGQPWPIQDMSWAGKFHITPPEQGGDMFRITPQSAHGVGNLSIRLVDMITPLTMRIETGLDWVHYRLDVRIPKSGPLAKAPLIQYGGLKTTAGQDDQLVGILDGTPPDGAEKLMVNGVDGRTTAWMLSGKTYLRTPLTLLSPGWDSSVSSADGMNVYTLNNAPLVLLSDGGRMVRAHIVSDEEVTP
ncbi:MAG: type IV secretion protein DotH [Alphaproteobacteria bacterium]|nr:type IV secretion protein DotH [Alphaproteobacteria bacterium]